MRYFSLFTGIGGFELGIEQAYETLRNADRDTNRRGSSRTSADQSGNRKGLQSKAGQGAGTSKRSVGTGTVERIDERPLCVGFSEIDRYALEVYQRHFPTHKNYGDITKIDARDLPDFELLCGGFPCQAFSIAGKRRGLQDTRGTLFFDIARIAKEKQPRLLLLENVRGLLSHDQGNTFATIISTFDELGYDLQWQVLNSKNHGVPQNRERVIIIGHLRGSARPEVFPFGAIDQESGTTRDQTREEVANTVKAKLGGPDLENSYMIPEATRGGYAFAREGDSINLSNMNSKTRRGRVGKKIAQTIDTGMQQHTLTVGGVRRLTPLECERLQGFPDQWTEGLSDTQRYKCCGNAITVNVVRDVCIHLLK